MATIETRAGWGRPSNAPDGARTHWWNGKGEPACQLDNPTTSFSGPRAPDGDEVLTLAEACIDCLVKVTDDRKVLL